MKKWQQTMVPMIALVFLLAAAPAKAEDDEEGRKCTACAECHPDTFWCLHCAERVMNAIGGCCGNGEGTAYCHADSGFSVQCENEVSCQCNKEGSDCEGDGDPYDYE
ncbi:MAG: hypothetical protein WD690_01645 [Vicinamibacterales bacterium]